MYNIIVCDDERDIVSALEIYLTAEGYHVLRAENGREALALANSEDAHLMLLDVMMPQMDGLETLSRLREFSNIPVILLTAKSEDTDKILGLNVGADDYITKPFSPSELVARVDAVYRRVSMSSAKQEPETELRSGPFQLNIRSRSLTRDGQKIDLTQVEFQLMEHFMRNPNVALDRSALLTTVWGDSYFGDDKIVDVNVRRLRMKIEPEPSNPKYLTTVWGFGYKLSLIHI